MAHGGSATVPQLRDPNAEETMADTSSEDVADLSLELEASLEKLVSLWP